MMKNSQKTNNFPNIPIPIDRYWRAEIKFLEWYLSWNDISLDQKIKNYSNFKFQKDPDSDQKVDIAWYWYFT